MCSGWSISLHFFSYFCSFTFHFPLDDCIIAVDTHTYLVIVTYISIYLANHGLQTYLYTVHVDRVVNSKITVLMAVLCKFAFTDDKVLSSFCTRENFKK